MRIVSTLVSAAGLAGLLFGLKAKAWWSPLAKAVASAGFVGAAYLGGALASWYGSLILIGLGFGLAGDLLLEVHGPLWFLLGLGSFLLGHLAYLAAFALEGPVWRIALIALGVMAALSLVVILWLRGRLPPGLKPAVGTYIGVIALMTALAVGIAGVRPLATAGAIAFTLSDVAVARQQFVQPSFLNQAWGLPLYYLGQLLIAWSV
jgi:uncharacterized membrane protein YhhN